MTTKDIEAIERVVATVQHTQRHELVDEFVALFRDDAVWTTAHGKRLFGRAEIGAFTAQVLPGAMRHLTVDYQVEHVLFIRPDVAAVKIHQTYRKPDGSPADDLPPGSPLYVMSREDGEWKLTAGQNTPVIS